MFRPQKEYIYRLHTAETWGKGGCGCEICVLKAREIIITGWEDGYTHAQDESHFPHLPTRMFFCYKLQYLFRYQKYSFLTKLQNE